MNRYAVSIITAAIIFGLAGVFIKGLETSVVIISSFRTVIPLLILSIITPALIGQVIQRPNKKLMAASLLSAVRIVFWVLGFIYADISRAVIILFLWPIFFSVLSHIWLNDRLTTRGLGLLALSFTGIVCVYGAEGFDFHSDNVIGMSLMLVVAIIHAINITVFKNELSNTPKREVLFYDNLIGALLFFPAFIYGLFNLTLPTLSVGILYGATIGYVGYLLLYYGLSHMKSANASVLCYLEVVSAIMCGVILFDEVLTLPFMIGAGLIITSVVLMRREQT